MFRTHTKLLFAFLVLLSTEHLEAKVKLSKKYTPTGNPGGIQFNEDENFAESYEIYEKRRKILEKKKNYINKNKKLSEKKIKGQKLSYPIREQKPPIGDENSTMVNQHGIDLARLKGAIFIDQQQVHQKKNKEQKKIASSEKKNHPIKVPIKDASLEKKVCSHDSVLNCDDSDSSNSFESVTDANS
ncbi:MAG: TRP75-related protein [Wolbachia endosymbiont of Fragariocoptes setiger]|nr:TRP75-related protein [Wolbachia endosymbiont of Fragariocoptes setiger]